MKKKKLALFDLDDTLFHGDTEGVWVKYMDNNGLIRDSKFFDRIGLNYGSNIIQTKCGHYYF